MLINPDKNELKKLVKDQGLWYQADNFEETLVAFQEFQIQQKLNQIDF